MVANGLIKIKLFNHSCDTWTTHQKSLIYNNYQYMTTISCKNQAICYLFTYCYCIKTNTLQINFTNSSAGLFSGKWDPGSNGNSTLGSVLDDLSPDNVCWIFCVTLQKLTKKAKLKIKILFNQCIYSPFFFLGSSGNHSSICLTYWL